MPTVLVVHASGRGCGTTSVKTSAAGKDPDCFWHAGGNNSIKVDSCSGPLQLCLHLYFTVDHLPSLLQQSQRKEENDQLQVIAPNTPGYRFQCSFGLGRSSNGANHPVATWTSLPLPPPQPAQILVLPSPHLPLILQTTTSLQRLTYILLHRPALHLTTRNLTYSQVLPFPSLYTSEITCPTIRRSPNKKPIPSRPSLPC